MIELLDKAGLETLVASFKKWISNNCSMLIEDNATHGELATAKAVYEATKLTNITRRDGGLIVDSSTSATMYGKQLPAQGQEGQIFFLLMDEEEEDEGGLV